MTAELTRALLFFAALAVGTLYGVAVDFARASAERRWPRRSPAAFVVIAAGGFVPMVVSARLGNTEIGLGLFVGAILGLFGLWYSRAGRV